MVDVLSLHSGTAFKHAFSKPSIFREFVRDVTGVDVVVNQIHTEYEYPERVGNVNIKYDLFAEDTENRIIIEIQHIKEEDFFARFLYYHLIGIIEQVTKHDAYEPPKTVYTIVVLASVPKDGSMNFSWGQHLMNLINEYNQSHQIAPHQLIFMNARKVNNHTPTAIKPWLELINDSFDKQIDVHQYNTPTFQELIARINRNTMTAEMSAAIKDEFAWDMATKRFHQEGVEEGLEKGIKQGLEQGRRQQKEETARLMIAEGFQIKAISKTTGLTEMEIESLV